MNDINKSFSLGKLSDTEQSKVNGDVFIPGLQVDNSLRILEGRGGGEPLTCKLQDVGIVTERLGNVFCSPGIMI